MFSNLSLFHLVSKPAPEWEGNAVVNGEFKELKLSDFLGKWNCSATVMRPVSLGVCK